ncbi:MAG: lipocalin-like domain-containing protein [Bacteroidaceae bacterium]|nr:lipocalin-like domain-containing protein [Bacteroidaceae bacterium]
MKHLLTLLFALGLALGLHQCAKVPRNGLLDGQWQLVAIDTADVRAQRIYWRFQLDMVQYYPLYARLNTDLNYTSIHSRFAHTARQLTLSAPFLSLRAEGRDSILPPDTSIEFTPVGLPQLPITFEVQSLTSSELVLSHGDRIWRLRKF